LADGAVSVSPVDKSYEGTMRYYSNLLGSKILFMHPQPARKSVLLF